MSRASRAHSVRDQNFGESLELCAETELQAASHCWILEHCLAVWAELDPIEDRLQLGVEVDGPLQVGLALADAMMQLLDLCVVVLDGLGL